MVLIQENSINNRLYPQRQRNKKNWSERQCQTEKKKKTRMQNKEKTLKIKNESCGGFEPGSIACEARMLRQSHCDRQMICFNACL